MIAAFGPTRRTRRPALGLDVTTCDGRDVPVSEEILLERSFCRLLRFRRTTSRPDPKLLVVAPMSGHFSALLRDLLAALLPDHDVHLVHWRDARDVPTTDGPFGLEDYIADLMDCIRAVDGDLHVMGVCQSAIPVIAATALLAADKMPVAPASMILFNGMIDPRIRPSRVARLSAAQASVWFMRACMSTVPAPHAGAGRLVYPAILRHQALLGHLARHVATGGELLDKLWQDDGADPSRHPFAEQYLSVMDLPAQFVLDTIRFTFQEAALASGTLTWRGIAVDPLAIRRTALLTIEGGHDDVSSVGQTEVAHSLCRNIPTEQHAHYLHPEAGHFGTFHGKLWRDDVLPRVADFIRMPRAKATVHAAKPGAAHRRTARASVGQ
jgi:poly(3-hydroxybutyrate) depolymerase